MSSCACQQQVHGPGLPRAAQGAAASECSLLGTRASPARCRHAASWRRTGTCKQRRRVGQAGGGGGAMAGGRARHYGSRAAEHNGTRDARRGAGILPFCLLSLAATRSQMLNVECRACRGITASLSLVIQRDEDVCDERRQLRQRPPLHLDPLLQRQCAVAKMKAVGAGWGTPGWVPSGWPLVCR